MPTRVVAITLRSADRHKTTFPSAADFTIDLGRRVERVREVRLGSFDVPNGPTQYTVEEGRNDRVYFSEGIRVPSGDNQLKLHCGSTVLTLTVPPWLNAIHDDSGQWQTARPHGLTAFREWARGVDGAPTLYVVGGARVLLDDAVVEHDRGFHLGEAYAGSIHMRAIGASELVDYLTFAGARQGHGVRFHFERGRFWITSDRHDSSSDRLEFVPADGLGTSMGFTNGQRFVWGDRRRTGTQEWSIRGRTMEHFEVRVRPGFYDPPRLAAELERTLNWGYFNGEAVGQGDAGPVCSFGFRYDSGRLRVVTISAGLYTPHGLAAAIQSTMNALVADSASFVVTFERRRFSFASTSQPFDLVFDPVLLPSDARAPVVADRLGFHRRVYSGRARYAGSVIYAPEGPGSRSPSFVYRVRVAPTARRQFRLSVGPAPPSGKDLEDDARLVGLCTVAVDGGVVTDVLTDTANLRRVGERFIVQKHGGDSTANEALVAWTRSARFTIVEGGSGYVATSQYRLVRATVQGDVRATRDAASDLYRLEKVLAPFTRTAPPLGFQTDDVIRVRVNSQTLYVVIDDAGRVELPLTDDEYSVRYAALADAPRLDVFVEDESPSGTRPHNLYRTLGFGHRDLCGADCYDSTEQWDFNPGPYVLLRLLDGNGHTDTNIVRYRGSESTHVLARLIIGSKITQTTHQVMQMACGGYRTYTRVRLQVLNPDFSLYRFHGGEYHLTLHFVYDGDAVQLPCV